MTKETQVSCRMEICNQAEIFVVNKRDKPFMIQPHCWGSELWEGLSGRSFSNHIVKCNQCIKTYSKLKYLIN